MKKRIGKFLGIGFLGLGLVWAFVAPHYLGALPSNYHLDLRQSGETHLYSKEGGGRVMSIENLEVSDYVLDVVDGYYLIDSTFRAFNREGTLDFDATSHYVIDPKTRENIAGYVENDREGMYMFPSFVKQKDYYMHSPMVLESPSWVRFNGEVQHRGESLYRYDYYIEPVDKTHFFQIAQLEEGEAIYGDHEGFMLVEPVSGYVVHFSHNGSNNVVDAQTGEHVRPYEDWFNVTNEDSSDVNLEQALSRKQELRNLHFSPVFLLAFAAFFFFYFHWAYDNKTWHRYLANKEPVLKYVSVFTFVFSLIVFFGWFLDIENTKSLIPGLPTMKLSTSFCFVLLGLAYFLISSRKRTEAEQLLIVMCAGFVLIVMSLLGLSALFDLNVDIITLDDGSPSVGTILCFILFATPALVDVVGRKIWKGFFLFFSGASSVIGLMAFIGYAIHQPMLYFASLESANAMALHTALLFSAMGLASLWYYLSQSKIIKN